jgi:hypothetical protein
MSAEKCGSAISFFLPDGEGTPAGSRPFSIKADRMLRKIRHKFPDFDPALESEIWFKAYNMGLTEDE